MSRILIAEDEARIAAFLEKGFAANGFTTVVAADGEDALRLAQRKEFDLLVLDLGLPGMDGFEVLRALRGQGFELPVVMLTARSEEVDKLVGLAVGADDYVTKPFSPREVTARVKAVLRRGRGGPAGEDARLVFDGLTIDPAGREIELGDSPVELSSLEFDLLLALARAPGRVFSRAQLLEQVWGYDFYGDERVVDVHIRSLRAELGDDAADPHLIATVRGVGYKFIGRPS